MNNRVLLYISGLFHLFPLLFYAILMTLLLSFHLIKTWNYY